MNRHICTHSRSKNKNTHVCVNQVSPAKRRKKTTPITPSNPSIRSDLETPVPPVLDDESEWNAAVNKARKATRQQHTKHNDMPDTTITMKVCLHLCRYVYACRCNHIHVCISIGFTKQKEHIRVHIAK